jgi:hypothetical protein
VASVSIETDDVKVFALNASDDVIERLIAGTLARAALFAPCLKGSDLSEDAAAAAKDILIGVVVRALEAGTGEITSMMAGSFQQQIDTTKRRAQRFRPDEVRELQSLCGIRRGGAFTIALTYDAADANVEGT